MHTYICKHAILLAFSIAFLACLRCVFDFPLPTACVCATVWQAATALFSWPRRN